MTPTWRQIIDSIVASASPSLDDASHSDPADRGVDEEDVEHGEELTRLVEDVSRT